MRPRHTYYIYALLDPDTWAMFYIGQTNNMELRFKFHLKESMEKTYRFSKKELRIREIVKRGKKPIMMQLCTSHDGASLDELEAAYIIEMRRIGHRLTNGSNLPLHKPDYFTEPTSQVIARLRLQGAEYDSRRRSGWN